MNIIQGICRKRIRIAAIAVVLAVAGLLVSASQIAPARAAAAHAAGGGGPKPTIVLEHGAWADGSSWDGVIGLLQAEGYTVYAPPDPLRGLANEVRGLHLTLHVRFHEYDLAAARRDLRRDPLAPLDVAVGEGHLRPFRHEPSHRGLANPRGPPVTAATFPFSRAMLEALPVLRRLIQCGAL